MRPLRLCGYPLIVRFKIGVIKGVILNGERKPKREQFFAVDGMPLLDAKFNRQGSNSTELFPFPCLIRHLPPVHVSVGRFLLATRQAVRGIGKRTTTEWQTER